MLVSHITKTWGVCSLGGPIVSSFNGMCPNLALYGTQFYHEVRIRMKFYESRRGTKTEIWVHETKLQIVALLLRANSHTVIHSKGNTQVIQTVNRSTTATVLVC